MTNLQRFAMALAGFAAGFVLAGVLMVVVIEAFKAFTGLKFKILFFDKISAPILITVYGPLLGTFVGLIGSALPAISSRKVKVSEVFAQVT